MKKRTAARPSAATAKRAKSASDQVIPGTIPRYTTSIGRFRGEPSVAERHNARRYLRAKVPREAHGGWTRPADHPAGVEIILRENKGRQQDLVPLRMARRTTDPAAIVGYCGKSVVLGDALALWTESYGDQTVLDHAALVATFKNDRKVQALMGA
jgi:hypothetical protein